MSFTVYIDQSGDCGIDKVRTNDKDGATPYLTLGAVLIKDSEIEALNL